MRSSIEKTPTGAKLDIRVYAYAKSGGGTTYGLGEGPNGAPFVSRAELYARLDRYFNDLDAEAGEIEVCTCGGVGYAQHIGTCPAVAS